MSDFPVIVGRAGLWSAEDLSDVAATTFPLACPPGLAAEDFERLTASFRAGARWCEDYIMRKEL